MAKSILCNQCGTEFTSYRIRTHNFCSRSCWKDYAKSNPHVSKGKSIREFQTHKICSVCKVDKSREFFRIDKTKYSRLHHSCIDCERKYFIEYFGPHNPRPKAKPNPEYFRKRRLAKYGLTPESFYRLRIRQNNGLCYLWSRSKH